MIPTYSPMTLCSYCLRAYTSERVARECAIACGAELDEVMPS